MSKTDDVKMKTLLSDEEDNLIYMVRNLGKYEKLEIKLQDGAVICTTTKHERFIIKR